MTPSIEAWAIKAPEYKMVHDDIPLEIPIIFGILAWINFEWAIYTISASNGFSIINIVAGVGLWAMGAFVMGKVGYRCVRVSIQEIESTAAKEA